MRAVHRAFAQRIDRLLNACSLVIRRLLANYWRLRGAQLGRKSEIGWRLQLMQPWLFRAGIRCVIESDVSIKIVDDKGSLTVGDHCYFARFSQFDLSSNCVIGEHVLIATGCLIVDHNHGLIRDRRIDEQPCTSGPVKIGSDVWLGANSVVLPGVTIGNGAVIGANACVTAEIPPYSVAVGVPARVIGMRQPGQLAKDVLLSAKQR